MKREDSEKELKNFIHSLSNKNYKRCLFADKNCKGKIAKAHSIQNSVVLEKLSKNSKVIILTYNQNLEKGPELIYKLVGRNDASTFTGLCEYHDNKIFERIEKNEIDIKDGSHLFLLAYRALLREYHSSICTSRNLQDVLLKSKELDLLEDWNEEIISMNSTMQAIQSYLTYRYKFYLDKIYFRENYHFMKHIIYKFAIPNFTIAVNSMFAPINNLLSKNDKEDPKFLILNILPLQGIYYCIFTYRFDHENIIKEFLQNIINAEGDYQLYLISKLVLQNCENFVISPEYFSNWSESKKMDIIEYFTKNIYGNKIDYENENLFLF